jgi:hypothetical protein
MHIIEAFCIHPTWKGYPSEIAMQVWAQVSWRKPTHA